MDEQLAAILNAEPNPETPYVYPGTKTHINKFGILNPDALERVVRTVTELRARLICTRPLEGCFDFDHLRATHQFLFQDIYEWAGEIRIVDFGDQLTNPLKRLLNQDLEGTDEIENGPGFSKASEIRLDTERVLRKLEQEDLLAGMSGDQFSSRLAYYLIELYTIHPFRDGNGRAIRCFLNQLANRNGWNFSLDHAPMVDRHLAAFKARCGAPELLREQVLQGLTRIEGFT